MQQRRRLPLWIPLILVLGIIGMGIFLLLKPMPAIMRPEEKPLDAQKLLEHGAPSEQAPAPAHE